MALRASESARDKINERAAKENISQGEALDKFLEEWEKPSGSVREIVSMTQDNVEVIPATKVQVQVAQRDFDCAYGIPEGDLVLTTSMAGWEFKSAENGVAKCIPKSKNNALKIPDKSVCQSCPLWQSYSFKFVRAAVETRVLAVSKARLEFADKMRPPALKNDETPALKNDDMA